MMKHDSGKRIVRLVSGIVALAMMGVIFFFSSQPGETSDKVSINLIELLFGQGIDAALRMNFLVREAAHIAEFFVLSVPVLLFFWSFRLHPKRQAMYTFVVCALYAVSDELHQLFVPDRGCDLFDVMMDILGAFFGALAISSLLNRFWKKKRAAFSSNDGGVDALVLAAFSAFVTETPLKASVPDEQIDAFLAKSFAQKILPMTAEALLASGAKLHPVHREELKREAALQTVGQVRRTAVFLHAYRAMRQAGAAPLCVKGAVCRALYPKPDLRISADEDLLADKTDFAVCVRTLRGLGFVPHGSEDDYEITFRDEESGCEIELHRSLFPENGGVYSRFNAILGDLFHGSDVIVVDGTELLCPAPTEHLLYMILHAFKHFLVAGVGIRQIADIAVFARFCPIDWPTVFEKCDELRLTGFLNAVLRIGAEQFGLDVSGIRSPLFDPSIDVDALLTDVMAGGVYGARDTDSRRSGNLTFKAYTAALLQRKSTFFAALFPPPESMRRRFDYAAKHRWLLPVAYISRIFGFLFSRHDTSKTFSTAGARSELMQQYGIF